jgi:hypothetical protein
MPKGLQRSNREAKKPKQSKKPIAPATPYREAPARMPIQVPGKKT